MNNYPNRNPQRPDNRRPMQGAPRPMGAPQGNGRPRPNPQGARPRPSQPPRQGGRPGMPRDGRPVNGNRIPAGGRAPVNNRAPVRRNPPRRVQRGGNGCFTKVIAVWVAILAVVLAVIMVISFACGYKKPAEKNDTTTTTPIVTTEPEVTYAVNYAKYPKNTPNFSSDLDFANGILIDIEKNEVVASRNGDSIIYPASMTKVMTLIVAVENAKDLDDTFTMTAEITDPLFQANASAAGFKVGEEVTVRDLIYGLILPSGGDGALGLAYHIAGSEEAFAEMMNDKVEELGLRNTHFTNCTGLHNDDHYSTCHEIALIVEYAIKDPFMRKVLTTYQYTTEKTPENPDGILLTSTLLSRMAGDESKTMFVQGGKTGYTEEAKNCLASFATPFKVGMTEDAMKLQPTKYILVTAGSGEKFGPVFAAIDIYEDLSGVSDDGAVTVGGTAEVPKETVKEESRPAGKTEKTKIYTAAPPVR